MGKRIQSAGAPKRRVDDPNNERKTCKKTRASRQEGSSDDIVLNYIVKQDVPERFIRLLKNAIINMNVKISLTNDEDVMSDPTESNNYAVSESAGKISITFDQIKDENQSIFINGLTFNLTPLYSKLEEFTKLEEYRPVLNKVNDINESISFLKAISKSPFDKVNLCYILIALREILGNDIFQRIMKSSITKVTEVVDELSFILQGLSSFRNNVPDIMDVDAPLDVGGKLSTEDINIIMNNWDEYTKSLLDAMTAIKAQNVKKESDLAKKAQEKAVKQKYERMGDFIIALNRAMSALIKEIKANVPENEVPENEALKQRFNEYINYLRTAKINMKLELQNEGSQQVLENDKEFNINTPEKYAYALSVYEKYLGIFTEKQAEIKMLLYGDPVYKMIVEFAYLSIESIIRGKVSKLELIKDFMIWARINKHCTDKGDTNICTTTVTPIIDYILQDMSCSISEIAPDSSVKIWSDFCVYEHYNILQKEQEDIEEAAKKAAAEASQKTGGARRKKPHVVPSKKAVIKKKPIDYDALNRLLKKMNMK